MTRAETTAGAPAEADATTPGAPDARTPGAPDAGTLGARGASTGPCVILTGPMGSGKTTVGQALAELTGRPVRDTDADVEAAEGRTIADIFTGDGEARFRELEAAAVLAALREHKGILALGGGSILRAETRAALAGHPVVFLVVSTPVGVKRAGLATTRPLLAGINPRATYKALLEARLPLYRERAVLEIDTDRRTPLEVATLIVQRFDLG